MVTRSCSVLTAGSEPSGVKKTDVIDLTIESSSEEEEEEEEPPLKKRCLYMNMKTEEGHGKGSVNTRWGFTSASVFDSTDLT